MFLDLTTVGARTGPASIPMHWRDAVLYALAVGAGPGEMDYLYEARGPRILPTFWTALAFRASGELLARVGAPRESAVFGECSVQVDPDAPPGWPGDHVLVSGRVAAIYAIGDLGIADLHLSIAGPDSKPLAHVQFQMYYPGGGPIGAPRPPRTSRPIAPARVADWVRDLQTRPEQALMYRLCGDDNPLHVDPAAAAGLPAITHGRPILHGLCTFGFVGRAVALASGQAVTSLRARFSRPAWPGDTLVVEGFASGPTTQLRVRTRENPQDDVLSVVIATTRERSR